MTKELKVRKLATAISYLERVCQPESSEFDYNDPIETVTFSEAVYASHLAALDALMELEAGQANGLTLEQLITKYKKFVK